MKGNIKKRISLLLAAVMVFTMMPAVGVPAVEVRADSVIPAAAQTEIRKAESIAAMDPNAVKEGTTCPMCGKTGISFEKGPNANADHWYLDQTLQNSSWCWNDMNSAPDTVCVILVGANITTASPTFCYLGDKTLNIMGTGTLTATGANPDAGQPGGVFNMNGAATVNIYGGTYIYTGADAAGAAVNTTKTGGTVNLYGGMIGTQSGSCGRNVSICAGSTFNMYGGAICNGANSDADYVSGNLTVNGSGASANIYAGTISGGKSYVYGGNVFARNGAQVRVYGGTVSDGTVINTNGAGGNLAVLGGDVEILGGNFNRGTATNGGNIANPRHHWSTGADWGGKLTLTGGTFDGGSATNGGNLYTRSDFTIGADAVLKNGSATSGGNVYIWSAKLTTSGQILDGTATSGGGNIYFRNGTEIMEVNGGVIGGGTAAQWGANIRINGATVTINDGYFYGAQDGTTAGGKNIYMTGGTLNINGGHFAGDIQADGGSVTLSGAPQVLDQITLPDGSVKRAVRGIVAPVMNADKLSEAANIKIYKNFKEGDVVFATSTKALELTGCFSNTWGGYIVAEGDNLIATAQSPIRRSQCHFCGEEVDWEPYDANPLGSVSEPLATHRHIYLRNHVDFDQSSLNMAVVGTGKLCLDLNGNTLNVGTGRIWASYGTVNIIGNGGQIISASREDDMAVLNATSEGKINLYGGTYTAAEGRKLLDNDRTAVAENATLNGQVCLDGNYSKLVLKGAAFVTDILLGAKSTAKLEVDSSWTGTAQLTVAEAMFENEELSADNGLATGSFTGTLKLSTGEKLIHKDGKLVEEEAPFAKIAANGVTKYQSAAEALADYTPEDFAAGNYIQARVAAEFALQGGSYYIDARGNAVTVSGTGTLYAMDSDNAANFENFGKWTVADGITIVRDVTVADGNRYVVITENGITSAHALVMKLSDVVVNVAQAGVYYNALYRCDRVLAEKVSAYGIIASLQDMPGAEMTAGDARTELHTFDPDHNYEVLSRSSTVYGIFKQERAAEINARYGKTKIYANAYLELDWNGDGETEILVGDRENVGKKAGNAWSLYDILKYIDENWGAFAQQQTAVKNFYRQWADMGMSLYADELLRVDDPNELELDNNGKGLCPVCMEIVQWTKYTGATGAVTGTRHYYLDQDRSVTNVTNAILADEGGKVCLHLNGKTLRLGGSSRLWATGAGAGGVINVIGYNGQIIFADGTMCGLQAINEGKINLYGGTYTAQGSRVAMDNDRAAIAEDAVINGPVKMDGYLSKLILKGTATASDIQLTGGHAKLEIDQGWTGTARLTLADGMLTDNTVSENNGLANGSFTGKLTLSTGQQLVHMNGRLAVKGTELKLDSNHMAVCPVCGGEPVQWAEYTGSNPGFIKDEHIHLYLSQDVTHDNLSANTFATGEKGNICFHFNGYTLTTANRVWASDGTVNLITENGQLIYTGENSTAGLIATNEGKLNLYGGTYTSLKKGKPILDMDRAAIVEDADLNGYVYMNGNYSRLVLKGDSNVTNIRLEAGSTAKLEVDKSWTGTARLTLADGMLKDGSVSADNGLAAGSFTGKLTLHTGETLLYNKGALTVYDEIKTGVAVPLNWKTVNDLPIANNDMTEDELRQLVLDFMRLQVSFAWKPSHDVTYKGPKENYVSLSSDKVYGGIPYVSNHMGNIYTAMEFYDEQTGMMDTSGGEATIHAFANQCSGSTFWAWNRVCNSITYGDTTTMTKSNGCIPVGNIANYPDDIAQFDPNGVGTHTVCQSNDPQAIYEAYALAKPADGLVTVCPANGHVLMISGVYIKRTADGAIDGAKSYVTYMDQDGVFYTEKQSDGTVYFRVGGLDAKLTFQQLFNQNYLPFAIAELNKDKEVAGSVTAMNYTGATVTVNQLLAASVSSNYSLSDITVVVKDAQGNQVLRKMTPVHSYIGIQNHKHSMAKVITAEELKPYTNGSYTVEVSARIGTGEKPVVYSGVLSQ